jgi:hypothetical protein
MAKVNISQAAKLVGKSRTTVHRKLKAGELSISNGLVDTSELIRVFGQLISQSEQKGTPVHSTKVDSTEQLNVQAVHQVELLELKLENALKEIALKDEINETLKGQIRLLEHNPSTMSEKPYQGPPESTFDVSKARKDLKEERKREGRLTKFGRLLFDT